MKVIEVIYKESAATIKLYIVSKKILIQKGVKQSDTIALKLLMAVLEEVFENLDWKEIVIKTNGK